MKKTSQARPRFRGRRDPSPFPKGWNRKRVETLIDYYEKQSDEDAIAEAEARYNAVESTMMQIARALVPQVERLLARRTG
jgi:hypothetical protein